jgi:carbamoyl-phosphate synthase large subunit
MPKRTDIKKILIIGSGPIIISQACEFDYSGTQACKALREEGYTVILINSNPATIMTDPDMADRTYIEPITPEMVEKIIQIEGPDAILPTLGGQTGLNTAVKVADMGILERYNVKMIGATPDVIKKAEDRNLFKAAMQKIGLDLPKSGYAYNMDEARKIREELGLPLCIRPSFTLGGTGGGIAYNVDEFEEIAARGLEYSMNSEILVEESVEGWKEFELEVMRDKKDNVVIVCSIENFDPMGIHTGDSITVAPVQTLTDKEYQVMRDAAIAIIREIGVETGGSNIQFAVNPANGRMVVIEMNPRVSRSSALASKATGFPIAKIAAKLAAGYTLDEIPNDITKETPACFEPTIDYCVVKMPRWTFEKFPDANPILTTQMKSVGEAMSIGRTFKEALQKAIRSMEISRFGLGWDRKDRLRTGPSPPPEEIREKLITPNAERVFYIRYALAAGMSADEVSKLTQIDPWFIHNMKELVDFEGQLTAYASLDAVPADLFREAKRMGYSDHQLANMWKSHEMKVRTRRKSLGIEATYKLVDTCAAEFQAFTPYYYSTYETECEARVSNRKKIVILGGGPNRIGQGIEFDYCCVQAAFAVKEEGYEAIMVNSNPETVSTDYDTSDLLFFEPLTREDVLNIWEKEKPDGCIVQFGGQTPLNLARGLQEAGVKIIGTSVDSIDAAEDRDKFQQLITKLKLHQAENGIATNVEEAREVAHRIGYPVLVRPSFVLGGRAMEIVYDDEALYRYMTEAVEASPERPVLVDKFLEDAIEVDVDCIADGETVVIGGVMEHIEEAGIHSGDSACALPPYTLSDKLVQTIKENTYALARELDVCGLMNVQYAVKNNIVYVLEVNPRASRTIPFVSKAIGVPLSKLATKVMLGRKLRDLGFTREAEPAHISVKESVFPFSRFPGVDIVLGPEMKSTGEVMGIDSNFGAAFAKSQIAASAALPLKGTVFVSVRDHDKRAVIFIAKKLEDLGFKLMATGGTAKVLATNGITVQRVNKIKEGRPNVLDHIKNGEIHLLINTPSGKGPKTDEAKIRSLAVIHNIPCITTISGAMAAVNGIESMKKRALGVKALQEHHRKAV